MVDTPDRAVATRAARHHGIFTITDAIAAGFTRDKRDKRLRAGRWEIVHPGVYRIAGVPEPWRGKVLADCLGARGLAIASHRSAAELWELPGARTDMVEITCERWRRSRRPDLVVHETTSLTNDDVAAVDGIPVATVEQTLLGLAAVVSHGVVEMALDRALRLDLTSRARLDEFVKRKGARGRDGVGVLRVLLELNDPFAGLPESAMETTLKRLLRRHGLPTPVFQYVIRDDGRFIARVDAAYPDLRIAIEFDSYEHHTGKLAIVRDNDRRNVLKQLHWETVTFTAADIRRDGGRALEALHVARARSHTMSAP
jgi:very-short-patch-repair endonuclease